ncbi:MAG: hypothetical protein V4532_09750, partial [Pseudomonadota bacterium]
MRLRNVYDSANRATFSIDAERYVTQYTYDSLGHIQSTTRYADKLQNTYVAGTAPLALDLAPVSGSASYVLKANAVVTTYNYDNAGRQTEQIDALGIKTKTAYDAAGRATDITQAYDLAQATTTHYIYDAAGRVTDEYHAYTAPEQTTTSYVLDARGQRTKIIDPRGIEAAEGSSAWAIAERVRILKISAVAAEAVPVKDSTDYKTLLEAYTTTQVFDANGRITQSIDALTHSILTEFDAFGNAIKVTDPNTNVGYFVFNRLNQATWHIDPLGYATETHYDGLGQVDKITKYASAVQNLSALLDSDGRPTGPPELGTQSDLDAYTASNGGALPTAFAYLITDGAVITKIEHDKLGHQTKITDAEGFFETIAYDGLGNKTSYTQKSNTHDVSGEAGTYTYKYDRVGNLIEEILPIKVKQYGTDGKPTTNPTSGLELPPVEVINAYTYDALGNRLTSKEAKGLQEERNTTYTYDGIGRELTKTGDSMDYARAGVGVPIAGTAAPKHTTQYDTAGNVISSTDANGAITYSYYDALNRKTAQLSPIATVEQMSDIGRTYALTTYTYNSGGDLIAQRTYTDPIIPSYSGRPTLPTPTSTDYRETLFTYDANHLLISTTVKAVEIGELSAITGNYEVRIQDLVTTKQYDANGNLIRETDARGTDTWRYYDKAGNLKVMVDGERYVSYWSNHDASGNVTDQVLYASKLPDTIILSSSLDWKSTFSLQIPAEDARRTQFIRDKLGRVTQQISYNVDAAKIELSNGYLTELPDNTATTSYEYSGLGQITQKTESTDEVLNWKYDTKGQQIESLGAKFKFYDDEVDQRQVTDTEYNALGLVTRSIE